MQTEPGLHNFVNNEFQVRASLQPLIRYAKKWVSCLSEFKNLEKLELGFNNLTSLEFTEGSR
ncbi:hypothetical protein CASFOL_004441 [Castilleja foliolosa]|uniref:Uncharacterized protein n=1 Tax=Castilleja foliolosa TaxID=1961234 RepID=A0ABD3EEJ5_9LAMI